MVQVVESKTNDGIYVRPVAKLYRLKDDVEQQGASSSDVFAKNSTGSGDNGCSASASSNDSVRGFGSDDLLSATGESGSSGDGVRGASVSSSNDGVSGFGSNDLLSATGASGSSGDGVHVANSSPSNDGNRGSQSGSQRTFFRKMD